jgi:hypothetical protein
MKKRKKLFITLAICLSFIVVVVATIFSLRIYNFRHYTEHFFTAVERENASVVYFTADISPEGLLRIYQVLGTEPTGNIGIKLHFGASPNSNHLRPELVSDLVRAIGGTMVETNTAGGFGSRGSAESHIRLAHRHGFGDIAHIEILDATDEIPIPVRDGRNLSSFVVGSATPNYDYFVVLSHFKGHGISGFGGALKNVALGFASSNMKSVLHGATDRLGFVSMGLKMMTGFGQTEFLEMIAEGTSAMIDLMEGNMVYINVMNRLSVDCDCMPSPAKPDMHDIGILASFDPVALDKACIDLVFNSPDGKSLIDRINSKNGMHTLIFAEELGIGNLEYKLVNID